MVGLCNKVLPSKLFKYVKKLLQLIVIIFLLLGIFLYYTTKMPGSSYSGKLNSCDQTLKNNLEKHILILSKEIGSRNFQNINNLNKSKDYIKNELSLIGLDPKEIKFVVNSQEYYNIEATIVGETDDLLVVGAHYDSAFSSPGANDNASGVSSLLEISRILVNRKPKQTIRIVAFSNEEPPFFWTQGMGSLHYANNLKKSGIKNLKMFSLETLGYYSDKHGSQKYPFPFNLIYPDRGNFIAFVGNLDSRKLLHYSINLFRNFGKFPSEGVASPGMIPGIGFSDHSSFWSNNYPAIMVTDTAPFRYPYYHTNQDTNDKIDYSRLCSLTTGLTEFFHEFSYIN